MNLDISELKHFLPSSWENSDEYETSLYITVELGTDSVEYQEIKSKFTKEPKSFYRIQHPIAFLRYRVETEYLNCMDKPFVERFKYMAVDNEDDLKMVLKYNGDKRYAKKSYELLLQHISDVKYLVIFQNRTTHRQTDKNLYPLYLLEFPETDKTKKMCDFHCVNDFSIEDFLSLF